MNDQTKGILAEFDPQTQQLLCELDEAMKIQAEVIRGKANWSSLNNSKMEVDVETLVWLKIMKGYGILFNRAIDAGWIKGVLTEDK